MKAQKSKKHAVMNQIWLCLIVASVISAALNGNVSNLTSSSFQWAKKGVELAIALVGAMTLWLGLVKIAEEGGMMTLIARAIRPVMKRLFPDVPPEDPAMSAMLMNMSANALGLGNAATPLGIKAMMALDKINPTPGVATNAMCLFLAINTSNVTLLPLGVIAVRAAAGATDPAAVLLPTILSTVLSTLVAVVVAKSLGKRSNTVKFPPIPKNETGEGSGNMDEPTPTVRGRVFLSWLVIAGFVASAAYHSLTSVSPGDITDWLIPFLILVLVLYGYSKGVPVYEAGIEGGKEGFQVAVKLIPYLVMILVAVGMFRASGAFEMLTAAINPFTKSLGIPSEVLPVALLRPLSGSGAFGLMSEITARSPDSFAALLAGTIQGSTETTFYVLAVYFGAVGIKKSRHAVAAALAADLAGFAGSVFFCRLFS